MNTNLLHIKFEPVTLARLDGIPTPAHGNEEIWHGKQSIAMKSCRVP